MQERFFHINFLMLLLLPLIKMLVYLPRYRRICLFAGLSLLGLSLGALTEAVAETATDHLQVAHAASASGLPPLGLDGPVVCGK